jgi:transcriptional repressor NrdR
VAYVRFASVYRDFKDLPDFVRALESLMPGAPPLVPRAAARQAPVLAPPAEPAASGPAAPPILQPFKSTALFPDVDADRPAPPKRRKSR